MADILKIGVLAFQGDVHEHEESVRNAAKRIGIKAEAVPVRTKEILRVLDALIIPGGESTTLQKLCEREGMLGGIKKIKNIFGTCAGAILLAKKIYNEEKGQRTLKLMDVEIDRNAYGRQIESFEERIKTQLGEMDAVFIRAPKIVNAGRGVSILAENRGGILACEQNKSGKYYLASCFHPELTTTIFHEHFLKKVQENQN